MNHEEWAAEFNTLLHDDALSGTSRIAALEKLLASTATLARTAIGDWHMQQVSSAIAMAHEDCGNKSDAANVYAQLAETMESQIRSIEVATGFAYASAALLQFNLAQNETAVAAAKCASAVNGGNPAVRALYARRLAAGDSAQVAWGYCMTKLLRQVYGVWMSDTQFDPQFEAKKQPASNSQPAAPESADEKTETPGPKLETHKESACEEVTEISASLEPVAAKAEPEARAAEPVVRQPIDFRLLREQVPLQQVLERIGRVPVQGVQHRGPCPIHEPHSTSGRKFSANLKRQVFRCFDSGCGVQGNVLDLWQAFKKLDLYEAAEDLAITFGVTIPHLPFASQNSTENKGKKSRGHHPPGS